MYGSNTSRTAIKAELAEWFALAEIDANTESNTYPAPCDPADRDWLAGQNTEADADELTPAEVLDEPAATDEEWDEFEGWVYELGPDPEPDYAILMAEAWTLAPGAEADFEHCPGLIG